MLVASAARALLLVAVPAVVLGAAVPLAAQLDATDPTPTIAARTVAGAAGPIVLRRGESYLLAVGSREQQLTLPAGAELVAVTESAAGWLVAGTRPHGEELELLFLVGDSQTVREIAPPSGRTAALRERPVIFVAAGEPIGVAWLEGENRRSYAVRFASLHNGAFDEPLTIAPQGPGSQLALSGARLDDGRLLLVWAGYDGDDDEIWASVRGVEGDWSSAVRIAPDNHVPDITPALVVTREGALVAWSRLVDGDYRVVLTRLVGSSFQPARVAGPEGSLYPSFEHGLDAPVLLFRDARQRGWAVAEIEVDGSLRRPARIDAAESERPLVELTASTILWRFGDRRVVAAWP